MKIVAIVLLIAVGGAPSCSRHQPEEEALRARLELYNELMASQRYTEAWELWSERERDANDNDPQAFADGLTQTGLLFLNLDLLEIHIDGDTATVEVLATYGYDDSLETRQQREELTWVKEHDQWMFHDYRVVTPPN